MILKVVENRFKMENSKGTTAGKESFLRMLQEGTLKGWSGSGRDLEGRGESLQDGELCDNNDW